MKIKQLLLAVITSHSGIRLVTVNLNQKYEEGNNSIHLITWNRSICLKMR